LSATPSLSQSYNNSQSVASRLLAHYC